MLSENSAMKNENGWFPDLCPTSVHSLGEIPRFQPAEEREALAELTNALLNSEVHQTLSPPTSPAPWQSGWAQERNFKKMQIMNKKTRRVGGEVMNLESD